MRLVDRPVAPPHMCAVIPGRGPAIEKEGFIATGTELPGWDPMVYISMAGAREVARFIGWCSPQELEDARARVEELELLLSEAEHEAELWKGRMDAIDVIESHGFRARKKAGRPKKEQVA